jgi:hypothetical protein
MLTITENERGGLTINGRPWGWQFSNALRDAGAVYDKDAGCWACPAVRADAVRRVAGESNRIETNFYAEQGRLRALYREHGPQVQRPLPEAEEARARSLIQAAAWRTARSSDHQYTLRPTWAADDDFCWLVLWIREHGAIGRFYGQYYLYLHLDGHRYWSMGDELADTSLINRAAP